MVERWIAMGAIAMAGGCADIDIVDLGECGNNVVEPDAGEDCDTIADDALGAGLLCGPADGGAQQCRYVCDGALCPRGWACEDDGICRAPSGTFEVDDTPVAILRAEQILLADLAGDEVAELVVRQRGDIFVFGSDDEQFVQQIDLSIDNARGELFARDLDGDEYADLLIPAASRFADPQAARLVHALRGDGERLVSAVVPQTGADKQPGGHVDVERIVGLAAIETDPDGGAQVLLQAAAQSDGRTALFVAEPSCAGLPASATLTLDETPSSIAAIDASALTVGGPTQIAVGFVNRAEVRLVSAQRACGVGVCEPATATTVPCVTTLAVNQTLSLPGMLDAHGCTFFDDDLDADADLLCQLDGGTVVVAINQAGTLDPFVAAPAFDDLADLPAGQSRSCDETHAILAAVDLDRDGDIDVVTPHGVFFRDVVGFRRVFARTLGDAWGEAAVGDFDRDDGLEIVATVRSAQSGCESTDVQHLLETQASYDAVALRNVSLPVMLRVGDFDGDGIDDVAAVEQAPDSGFDVAVLFGDSKEALEDKAAVGSFSQVGHLAAFTSREATDINDELIGDLAIASEDGEQMTVVTGTSKRSLLSPLRPDEDRAASFGDRDFAALAGILVPRSVAAPPDDGGDDDDDDGSDPSPGTELEPDVLILAPDQLWLYRDEDLHHGDHVVRLAEGQALAPLRAECSTWAVGPAEAGVGSLIAGVDGHVPVSGPTTTSCDPWGPAPTLTLLTFVSDADPPAVSVTSVAMPGVSRIPTRIEIADLDRDGTDDIVIHTAYEGMVRRGAVWLVRSGSAARALSAADFVNVVPNLDVAAATVINVDADEAPEIAAMTTEGLVIVDVQDTDIVVSEPVFAAPAILEPTDVALLAAGELDGGGLDDLALLWGRQLFLYPQEPAD